MDRSSDQHFLHGILGRTVKLTLKHSTFQGVLQHLDPSPSILLNKVELLDNIEQHAGEGKTTTATKCRDIAVTKIPTSNKGEPLKPSIQDLEAHFQEMQEVRLSTFKYIFTEDQREKIEYVVVDQFQKKFGYAMMHIKKQTVCGIAAEGINLCRYGKLSWLQVATRSQVFLFDIFLLGPRVFKNGLQIILEDQHILKVIHDCRWLSDCLSHQYGIELTNVFDTQVADVMQFSVETGGFLPLRISNLQECLIEYLGMSRKDVSFMDLRQREIERNPDVWFMRPLSPALLNVLALETVYLLPLRLMLLDEIMSDLTTLVDRYLNAFRKESADLFGSTEISSMKLPQELRQLKDFHKIRREKALRKFQVNEDGLLIRKHIEPLQGKRAQKDGNEENGTELISSNMIASPKAYSANNLHPVCHENSKKVEQKVSHCDNQGDTVRGNIEDAWRQEAQLVNPQTSNHEPQTKIAGTLEKEIRQLLTQ
ncbi:piRNA biogenesis protein EXD1 isoform X2 [Anolis carolinensis]|uniref:piRNA biogenesis protein EXD1 isoform X2 n=1 Tax=Anolis carolinensis TaxID=28377 RepID=UPI00046263A9|nr:PREDICTED: piRNA biogenesis protein EXD1 isoform X2 [Anolis carolinensis]|eukprot:XP_008102726.1 PREDICTED: piRNA biogenesis protein EXD1 isoform X2 [Anolis carolinensis]